MSTTDSTTTSYRIEALRGGENYRSWKVQLLDILTDSGYEDHIDPNSIPSTPDAKWTKADRRALSAIRLRISPDIIHHIEGETTALSAWEMLAHIFELKGKMGLVLARRNFYGTRADATAPLEDHIKLMRKIQGELKSLKQEVTDADFAIALLGSLPEDWDTFVQSHLSGSTPPTSKDIISDIHTEEERRRQRDGGSRALVARPQHTCQSGTSAPKRTYTATRAPSHKPAWTPKNSTCNRCGGRGHYARDCPTESDNDVAKAHPAYVVDDEPYEYNSDSDNDFAF